MKWSSRHPVYREVWARDRGLCQRCGSTGHQVHHKRIADRREGKHVADRLIVLCFRCHGHVHENPADSYEHGWLMHSWEAA